MKRALTFIVMIGVQLLAIGAGVYAWRLRAKARTPSQAATTKPAMPSCFGRRSADSSSRRWP